MNGRERPRSTVKSHRMVLLLRRDAKLDGPWMYDLHVPPYDIQTRCYSVVALSFVTILRTNFHRPSTSLCYASGWSSTPQHTPLPAWISFLSRETPRRPLFGMETTRFNDSPTPTLYVWSMRPNSICSMEYYHSPSSIMLRVDFPRFYAFAVLISILTSLIGLTTTCQLAGSQPTSRKLGPGHLIARIVMKMIFIHNT